MAQRRTLHAAPQVEQKETSGRLLPGRRGQPVCLAIIALLLAFDKGTAVAAGPPPPLGVWSKPAFGSTSGLSPPKDPNNSFLEDDSTGDDDDRAPAGFHMSMTGKPCVKVAAEAQPNPGNAPGNPKLFFHMILAANACGERILMQVCYYQTDTCTLLALPPYGRKEAMLGEMPEMKDFRYEYREQVERRPTNNAGTSPTQ
jgi:hypothetical protein